MGIDVDTARFNAVRLVAVSPVSEGSTLRCVGWMRSMIAMQLKLSEASHLRLSNPTHHPYRLKEHLTYT